MGQAMRAFFTSTHRYVGLGMAVFLFISGVTGAVIGATALPARG